MEEVDFLVRRDPLSLWLSKLNVVEWSLLYYSHQKWNAVDVGRPKFMLFTMEFVD